MAFLTSVDESVVKKKFEIKGKPVFIGRHPDCDVVIEDVSVSRRHAKIIKENGSFYVEDIDSRNGTLVNNNEIHRRTKLFDGSEIKICEVLFTFHLAEEPSFEAPRQTLDSNIAHKHQTSSILLESGDNSTIMSQLEIPSHHGGLQGKVSPEEKLKALVQITEALAHGVERNPILQSALDCLFDLFIEADRGFIAFGGPEGRIIPTMMKTRSQNEEQIRLSQTIVHRVMETRQAILSSDATADSRFDLSQSIADFRIRCMMCAPILNAQGESIGVIQLDTLRPTIAFQEEDLEILVTAAMQIGLALQRLDYFEELKKSAQVRTDLELAHEVQQRFLPQANPAVEGYEFYAYYKAAERVGGDYYDYIDLENGKIAVIVADVVGHGIAAALLMAKLSGEARFALASNGDPERAFNAINQKLSDLNLDKFVTAIMGLLDTETNKFTFVNAGHMAPIVCRPDGTVTSIELTGSGMPLGILESTKYGSTVYELKQGELLLLYTDGVNECLNADGEQLSTQGLINEIKQSQSKTPEALGNTVYTTLKRFSGSEPQHDDVCYVVIGR